MLGTALESDAREHISQLSPEALQHRTSEAIANLFQRMAEAGPLAVAFDDLHWSDASSVDLIEHLFSVTRNCALLLVIAGRSEPDHPYSRLKQVAASDFPTTTRVITLDALSDTANRELLAALVGQGTLPAAVEARILAAAEGNPFYLEELIRLLVDAQALIRKNDRWHFEHDVLVEIPQTVEKVILTRSTV